MQGDRKGIDERTRQVRDLHAQGLIDREIAAAIGINPASVARLRYKLGLEANGPKRRRHTANLVRGRALAVSGEEMEAVFGTDRPHIPDLKWSPEEAVALWEKGLVDREIAERLNVSRSTISRWRRTAGLSRNGRPGPRASGKHRTARAVICHRCNYRWLYTGQDSRKCTCPSCHTTVTFRQTSSER